MPKGLENIIYILKLSYNHLLKKTVLSPLYKVITLLKINCPYMHTSGNELSISFHLFTCLSLYQYNIVLIAFFKIALDIPLASLFALFFLSSVLVILGSLHFHIQQQLGTKVYTYTYHTSCDLYLYFIQSLEKVGEN